MSGLLCLSLVFKQLCQSFEMWVKPPRYTEIMLDHMSQQVLHKLVESMQTPVHAVIGA